uniref:Putative secreted protein n=1 Tax=Anopheles darlingi TaxID=43151 RepID=A0A2M4D6Q4_ANODA
MALGKIAKGGASAGAHRRRIVVVLIAVNVRTAAVVLTSMSRRRTTTTTDGRPPLGPFLSHRSGRERKRAKGFCWVAGRGIGLWSVCSMENCLNSSSFRPKSRGRGLQGWESCVVRSLAHTVNCMLYFCFYGHRRASANEE